MTTLAKNLSRSYLKWGNEIIEDMKKVAPPENEHQARLKIKLIYV